MATDFGTVDDNILDHSTLHTLRRYSQDTKTPSRGVTSGASTSTSYRYSADSSEDSDDPCSGDRINTRRVGQCLDLLRDVAEEWQQQNSFAGGEGAAGGTPGKELLQRQIETLHAIRRHYIDELAHFVEQAHSALQRKDASIDDDS